MRWPSAAFPRAVFRIPAVRGSVYAGVGVVLPRAFPSPFHSGPPRSFRVTADMLNPIFR